MEKDTLKRLRLIIPGIIIFLLIIPGLTDNVNQLMDCVLLKNFKISDLLYSLIFIIFGALYYILNLRWLVWQYFVRLVQDNIKDTILKACEIEMTSVNWYKLKSDRGLMNIFYEFVDTNASLLDKAKDVRFNGLIWSSCVDMTILFWLAGIIYTLFFFFTKDHYIFIALVSFWISSLSVIFSFVLTKRHISLSNKQLDMIIQQYSSQINDKIQSLSTSL